MYAVLLTILLTTGAPSTIKIECPDLLCVAYVMVAANEGKSLARVQVLRSDANLAPGGRWSWTPPLFDLQYL